MWRILLVRQSGIPHGPLSEEQAAALFAPNRLFSLNCLYAQIILSMFFLGIFTVMVVQYWMNAADDPWWTKGTVIACMITLCISASYMLYYLHFLLIYNWGTYKAFLETDKSGWFPVLDVATSVVTQGFFSYRAFRLTGRNWFILAILVLLILTSMGCTIAVSVIFFNAPNQLWAGAVLVPELLWLSAAMTIDLIITGSILYGLWNSRTGWAHTDRVIGRLIRMTLEAQVPPLLLATTLMIVFAINPRTFLSFTFTGIQPYIYSLGLLYSLNSRIRWKQGQSVTMNHGTYQGSQRQTAAIMVDVETETYETRLERPPPAGVNRRAELEPRLEEIDDVDWDTEKTGSDSVKSTTFNKTTPRATTPEPIVIKG